MCAYVHAQKTCHIGADEMSQSVKVPAAKPDDHLSLIPQDPQGGRRAPTQATGFLTSARAVSVLKYKVVYA